MIKTVLKYALLLSVLGLAGCNEKSTEPVVEPACTSGFDDPSNRCFVSCDTTVNHRDLTSGRCIPNEQSCPVVNGIGKKIWNSAISSFGSCDVVTCNPNYETISSTECSPVCNTDTHHRDPNNFRICTVNEISCPFPNGQGTRTWIPAQSAYGSCVFQSCSSGYFFKDSTEGCISQSLREYSLQISKSGTGVGTINDGNTIFCGESCSSVEKTIINNTNVTLFVSIPPGRLFNGWGADAASCGVSPICQIFMNGDKTVTTSFSVQSYQLTINAANNGSITGTSQGQYPYNTAVSLTATPASQYKFVGWTGAACQGQTATTCTFNISSDQFISANFAQIGRPVVQFSTPSLAAANNTKTVVYDLTFIDSVTVNLSASDIQQDGTAPACSSVVVEAGATASQKKVKISGCNGNGSKRIRVNAGVATNELNQTNNTSDFSSEFIVDNAAPTITVTNPALAISIEENPFLVQWTSPEEITMDLQLYKTATCTGAVVSSYVNQTSPFSLTFNEAGYFYVKFTFVDSAGNAGVPVCSARITKKGLDIIQSGFLFKDKGSSPKVSQGVTVNGKFYFPASTDATGEELFEYDPATQNSSLIKDLYAGVSGSIPTNLIAVGDILYFVATSDVFGREMWMFNTITRETSIVRDIHSGNLSSSITSVVLYGDKLYFNANDGTNGNELWEYNTVTKVAQMYIDINVGSGSSNPEQFLLKDDQLYLVATTPAAGKELWRVSLFLHNLYLTGDVSSGSNSSFPTNLTILGNKIYFAGETQQVNGRELFVYDIAADRVFLIADIFIDSTNNGLTPNSSFPDQFKVINNRLYFTANDGVRGRELRYYDPATAFSIDLNKCMAPINSGNVITGQQCDPTVLTQDFVAGSSSITIQQPMKVVNNSLFFVGYSPSYGYELWEYRTTNNAFYQIADIAPGGASANIGLLELVNGKLYFNANDQVRGPEMWSYEISTQTLAIVSDYVPGIVGSVDGSNFQALVDGNNIYLSLNDGVFGSELYQLDTTTRKIKILTDINKASTGLNGNFATIGTKVYFAAANLSQGMELWSYDMATDSVNLVQDILLGERSSNPENLTVANNRLYFTASSDSQGRELFYYDPSTSNLSIVSDINSGIANSNPAGLITLGNYVYFSGTHTSLGRELMRVDSTTNAVSVINDLMSGSGSSNPLELTIFNGRIYFSADWNGSPSGGHLFYYDPSTQTVARVLIRPAGSSSSIKPHSLTVLNGELYLTAYGDGIVGLEPHKVNTANVPTLLKDISVATNASSGATGYTLVSGTVYFSADDGYRGRELWKYEASSGGLVNIVADLYNGLPGSNPVTLMTTNNRLFYVANDGFSGVELWTFVPATLEIKTVVDYYAGNSSGNPKEVQMVNGKIYAYASDATGNELWAYDPILEKGYKMSTLADPFNLIQNIYLSKLIAINEVLILGVYNGQVTLFKMFE